MSNPSDLLLPSEQAKLLRDEGMERALLAKETSYDLKRIYPALTLEEVRISLYEGCRGEYGKYYGLNLGTFNLMTGISNIMTFFVCRNGTLKQRNIPGKQ